MTNQSTAVIWDSSLVASNAVARLKFIICPNALCGWGTSKWLLDFYTATELNSKKNVLAEGSGSRRLDEGLIQRLVLFRKDGTQIQQTPPIFDSHNHRRITAAHA